MDATSIIRIALSVLAGRLIVFLALGMVCGMTAWAMWGPLWERLADPYYKSGTLPKGGFQSMWCFSGSSDRKNSPTDMVKGQKKVY